MEVWAGQTGGCAAGAKTIASLLALVCGFILVALVSFAFVASFNLLLGFAGLILGLLAVLIDARAGNSWLLSGGLLVIFGLVTAVAIG